MEEGGKIIDFGVFEVNIVVKIVMSPEVFF